MLPEVRVLVERAEAHRFALEGLLDAIPDSYWPRTAPGDAWPARTHLQHLATIESLTDETVRAFLAGASDAWVGGASTTGMLAERRSALLAEVAESTVPELRELMRDSRRELSASLAALAPVHLDGSVFVAGLADAWGQPLRFSLREYLRSWPEHDGDHEGAIRRAIATTPDLSAAALVRRAQRGH